MTTIPPFAAGAYTIGRNTAQLLALKDQLGTLSTQLSTGQTAQTYGGLGTRRSTALAAQATISALTGYAAGITAAQTRTKLAVTSLTQVAALGTSTRTSLANGLQSTTLNTTATRTLAASNLDAALDALNQSAAGTYLFGGRDGSTQPVLDATTILNGTTDGQGNSLAGLRTLVSEQIAADGAGPNGTGRLTRTQSGTSIRLAEGQSARATPAFGFALASATTTGSGLAASPVSGSPASFTVDVTAQPAVGDSLTLTLKLPDGTSTTLTLTAAASADPASTTSFSIGGDTSATADNLSATLDNALKAAAGSTLAAGSTARAATNFFSASQATVAAGTAPLRVTYSGGEPTYVPGKATDTVIWYQGEDGPGDPRGTQTVLISATSTVQTGARANEPAIAGVLAGLATLALGLPDASDAGASAASRAVSARAQALLSSADTSPSVQDRVTELSLASTRLSDAATANTATRNTLQDTLDGIEQAPTEEVAAKLLDVQNRLQASYQITASLSKLSLVNYLG